MENKMAARQDAGKFVRLLAKQLQNANDGDYSADDLEEHFKGAVESLPESDLKRSLGQSFSHYLKQLISALKPSVKAAAEIKGTKQPLEYNLFAKGGLDKVLQSSMCASSEQRMEVYQRLWRCYPAVSGTERLFSLFPELLKEKNGGGSEGKRLEASLEMIKKYQQMTFGSYNEQSIVDSLKLFLEEISPICDECNKLSSSKQRQQRATILQNVIKDLIVLMHFRFQESKRQKTDHHCEDSYSDLVAALLSLCLDANLLSESINVSKHVGNSLFLILGHSPSHLMDVLLQLSALNEDNISHVLPLIRLVLKRNSTMLKHSVYIKFVSLARLACILGKNLPEDIAAIRQVVESQSAPTNFTSWLARRDQRLVENMALSRKMSGVQVTKHLLDTAKDNDMEFLLDVACDAVATDQSSEEPGEAAQAGDDPQAVPSGEGSLFFVDSTGDAIVEDSFQEIEYESNEAEEKMLHRQLTSLIDQLDDESDSEGEEMIDEILQSDSNATQPVQLPGNVECIVFDTEEKDETVAEERDFTASSHTVHSLLRDEPSEVQAETAVMESRESSDEQEDTESQLQPRRSKRTRVASKKDPSEGEEVRIQFKVKKAPRRSSRKTASTRELVRHVVASFGSQDIDEEDSGKQASHMDLTETLQGAFG